MEQRYFTVLRNGRPVPSKYGAVRVVNSPDELDTLRSNAAVIKAVVVEVDEDGNPIEGRREQIAADEARGTLQREVAALREALDAETAAVEDRQRQLDEALREVVRVSQVAGDAQAEVEQLGEDLEAARVARDEARSGWDALDASVAEAVEVAYKAVDESDPKRGYRAAARAIAEATGATVPANLKKADARAMLDVYKGRVEVLVALHRVMVPMSAEGDTAEGDGE